MSTTTTLAPIQLKFEATPEETNTYSEYDMLKSVVGEVRAPLIFSIYSIVNSSFYAIWISLFILIWIISGFAAFIASFVCLFYNSSFGDKIAGLVMALFAGPFYWLFYIYNSNYCNKYISYGY
jgi:hypothetical protein